MNDHYGFINLGNVRYEIRIVPSESYFKNDVDRFVLEHHLNRKLSDDETVYHIDADLSNNHPHNLIPINKNTDYSQFNHFLIKLLVQYTSEENVYELASYLSSIQDKLGPDKCMLLERVSKTIPLFDNHAHMGGSIEPEMVAALLAKSDPGVRVGAVRKHMTYQGKRPDNFRAFVKKFSLLEKVQWTEQNIYDCVHQIVSKIEMDGVDGSEIRFSIGKYRPYLNIPDVDIIKMIKRAFDDASEYFNVRINLVLAFRHNEPDRYLRVAYELDKYSDCVVGIDVSGDERHVDMDKFKPIFDIWGEHGKTLMIHAGEQPGFSRNVIDAIEKLHVTRIGHGIYADRYALDLAKDRNICFDLAISSNYYTGVVKHRHTHPAIRMMENGNVITVGTDDASVFCTSLRKEYALVREYWGLSDSEVNKLKINAINYSSFDICYE